MSEENTVFPWQQDDSETPDVKCVVVSQRRRCLYACRWRRPAHLKQGLPIGLPAEVMANYYEPMLEMLYGSKTSENHGEWKIERAALPFQRLVFWVLSWCQRLGRVVDLPPWIIVFSRGWVKIPWTPWMMLYGRRLICPAILWEGWDGIRRLKQGDSVMVTCPDERTKVVMMFTREAKASR